MKKLILSFLLLMPILGFSQLTTNNPDTVCYNSGTSTYQVPSLGAGYTYNWTVTLPGALLSGQGTNSITVTWTAANAGLITNAISVTATNTSNGCQSQPVTVNVLVLDVNPSISALGTFCSSSPCVTLVGNPNNGVWSGNGVSNGQFCPNLASSGNNVITYTISQGGCNFQATSTATVNTSPVLSPINHN